MRGVGGGGGGEMSLVHLRINIKIRVRGPLADQYKNQGAGSTCGSI